MNRLHAFFMALEFLNICSFNNKEGPMMYLEDLEEFRQDHLGLAVMVKVDKLIRRKVAQLSSDHKDRYPTYSSALLEVLKNRKHIWNDARVKLTKEKMDDKLRADSPDKDKKRKADQPAGKTKSANKSAKLKAKFENLHKGQSSSTPLPNPQAPRGSGGGTPRGTTITATATVKIPEKEWKALLTFKSQGKPRCRFWNSSVGCRYGTSCKHDHKCSKCGQDHPWAQQHSNE